MSDDTPVLFELRRQQGRETRFEPARLTQARAWRSYTKADLASKVGVSAAAIGQYEAGVNFPRQDVITKLANALEVHPEFFLAGRPLAPLHTVNAHFRSLRSARVIDRLQARAVASLLWELTFEIERYIKLPEANVPDLGSSATPAEAAAALRKAWNLPNGPVKHLASVAENNGIIIAVRPKSEVESVDAFSVVIVERPFIVTSPRRTENVFKHRFSIAHEIGHLVLHDDSAERSMEIEKEADEFAAAFLTPAAAMQEVLPQRLELGKLHQLSRVWGVSPTSLIRRMVELGRTTSSSARRAYQRLSSMYDPTADPSRQYPGENPTLLRKAAELASSHDAPVSVLAENLKLTQAQVRDFLGEENIRPVLRLIQGERDNNLQS